MEYVILLAAGYNKYLFNVQMMKRWWLSSRAMLNPQGSSNTEADQLFWIVKFINTYKYK